MIKTYEELGEELCNYCFCTEYGDNINLAKPSAYSNGCEGMYCKEAYENYLEECEEGEEEGDLIMSEISSLINKVNNLLDKIYKLEVTSYYIDFNIVSQNLTRDEMIQVIENDLTKCGGFYGCPCKYGLNGYCGTNCIECWLNAIKEVKFKGEE